MCTSLKGGMIVKREFSPFSLLGGVGPLTAVIHSNSCRVKSFEYLKLLFMSLGSPLVALERHIFKLTKGCSVIEKIEPKRA